MTERERLVRLIDQSPAMFCTGCNECPEARAKSVEMLADHLMASNVVAVVRCKDCKHFKMAGKTPICNFYKGLATTVNPRTDYCSYGERREK